MCAKEQIERITIEEVLQHEWFKGIE